MIVYKNIYEFLQNKEKQQYQQMIDYTNVSDNLDSDKIKEICQQTEDNNFYGICVLPEFVSLAFSFLGNNKKISALIDFPKGESDTKTKINKIDEAINNGADEVDVVINYKLIKNEEDIEKLNEEIRKLTEYCHKEGVIIKIIIEIGALNYQDIEKICRICINNNVDYIMTSTGKLPNDDSFDKKIEKVKFMRKILPNETKIKFSGGIRNYSQVKELLPFVDRVGTSTLLN